MQSISIFAYGSKMGRHNYVEFKGISFSEYETWGSGEALFRGSTPRPTLMPAHKAVFVFGSRLLQQRRAVERPPTASLRARSSASQACDPTDRGSGEKRPIQTGGVGSGIH